MAFLGLHKAALLSCAATACGAMSSSAFAQDSSLSTSDETVGINIITVTGQKIDQDLQDVTASVAIVSPANDLNGSVADLRTAIERVPNISAFAGDRGVAIRGVGQTGFGFGSTGFTVSRSPGDLVTTYYNGLPVSVWAGPNSFWDVGQVEIFRGAQSTTFGRGAPAGAVVIETAKPSYEWQGALRASVATEDSFNASGVVGGGLSDTLSFRATVDYKETDGFNENITANLPESVDELLQINGRVLFEPSPDISFLLSGLYWDRIAGSLFVDGGLYPNSRASQGNTRDVNRNDGYGLSLRSEFALSDNVRLEALTAFVDESVLRDFDIDQTALPIADGQLRDGIETISQELRLHVGSAGPVKGFFGVYAEGFDGMAVVSAGPFGTNSQQVSSDTYAVFGEAQIALSNQTELVLGARYQYEENDVLLSDGAATLRSTGDFDAFLPKISISQDISDSAKIFAKVERGFRAGGAGGSILTGQPFEFGPEYTWNYDLGLRSTLLDGKIRLNATAFYVDYSDQQLDTLSASGIPGDTLTANVGSAKSYGVEAELDLQLSKELLLFARLGVLKTEFTSQNPAATALLGNDFSFAPAFQTTFGGSYRHESGFFLSGSLAYSDGYFSDAENRAIDRVGSRTLVDVGIGYENDDWRLTLSAQNLFDKDYLLVSSRALTFFNPGGALAPGSGRQVKIELVRRF